MTEHERIFDRLLGSTDNIEVQACAGSGKSYAIQTGCRMVSEYSPTTRQHVIAFNDPIAKEMQRKLTSSCIPATCRTSHADGARIVQYHAPRRLTIDSSTRPLAEELKSLVIKDDIYPTIAVTSWAKNQLLAPEDVDESFVRSAAARSGKTLERPDQVTRAVRHLLEMALDYRNLKRLIFDDMLYIPAMHKLEMPNPPDILYVDEAQDLNVTQHALVQHCYGGARVMYVGDPNQAIYQFRGSHAQSMEEMRRIFKPTVLPLNVTRRCPTSVVDLAQRIVPQIRAMPDAHAGSITVGNLKWRPNALVLSRCNAPLLRSCLAILSSGKPAHIQGREMGDNLLAFLRRVVAFGKVRDISNGELERACDNLLAAETRKAHGKYDDPAEIAACLEPITDQIECIKAVSVAATTLSDLEQTIQDLFTRTDGMTFSSIHRAKGLEADTVFLLDPDRMPLLPWDVKPADLADLAGRLPPGRESDIVRLYGEAERNAAYVAATRSAKELVFVGKEPLIFSGSARRTE